MNATLRVEIKPDCERCGKSFDYGMEIKHHGIYCRKCFLVKLDVLFNAESEMETVRVRGLEFVGIDKKYERNKMTLKKRYSVIKRDKGKCVLCRSNERLEVDHIIAVSRGGKSVMENLQTLCFKCNRGKSDE